MGSESTRPRCSLILQIGEQAERRLSVCEAPAASNRGHGPRFLPPPLHPKAEAA